MSGVWSDGKEYNWAMCLLLPQGSLRFFAQHLNKLPAVRVETHKAFWGLGSELHTVSLAYSTGQSKSPRDSPWPGWPEKPRSGWCPTATWHQTCWPRSWRWWRTWWPQTTAHSPGGPRPPGRWRPGTRWGWRWCRQSWSGTAHRRRRTRWKGRGVCYCSFSLWEALLLTLPPLRNEATLRGRPHRKPPCFFKTHLGQFSWTSDDWCLK